MKRSVLCKKERSGFLLFRGGGLTMLSRGKATIVAMAFLAAIHFFFAQTYAAGSRIISANTTTGRCDDVKSYSKIQANAYHIKDTTGVNTALAQTQWGKPIILSDDGANGYTNGWWGSNPTQVAQWAALAHAAGQHYEHNDPILITAQESGGPYGPDAPHPDSIACLQTMGSYATPLTPNGTLTRVGGNFYWNGQQIQLFGSTILGGMIMDPGGNDYIVWLDLLQQYGCNFTRVWVIDQWMCLGTGVGGINAFAGSKPNYNLDVVNEAFITRMHNFIQAAAARGIVVQMSLSDRCGLKNNSDWGVGAFIGSPYYKNNNNKSYLDMPSNLEYARFLDTPTDHSTNIYLTNDFLYRRIASECKNYGNLIIECMNEPTHSRTGYGWTNARISAWHKWVADIVDEEFNSNPTEVSIDLGTINADYGITLQEPSDGDTTDDNIGGVNCRTNEIPGSDHYMYFDVSDSYAYQGNQHEQHITIHYYDTGSGTLALQYDSDTGDDIAAKYKNGGSVTLAGTNVWKQHTYHVTDAYFGNRQNAGADFRINQTTGQSFYLDIVEVRLTAPPNVAPIAVINANQTSGLSPLTVNFDASNSYDPDGGSIVSYEWDFDNDGTIDSTAITTSHEYVGNQDYVAALTVTDNDGDSSTDTVTISIASPIGDFDYDGDVDQEDFGQFQACMTGNGNSQHDPSCQNARLDGDEDVDAGDFVIFESCISGANVTQTDENCLMN